MSPLISEKKESSPILIVDKVGTVGNSLAEKLSNESTVVLVTEKGTSLENVIHIPFEKKIPRIPDNIYSHIFIIDDEEDITLDFLSTFFKKARDDKAVFCFCTHIGNQDKLPEDIFEYKKTRTVFLGDIFPAKGLYSRSYVNRFINSSKNRGKISVPQDGMTVSYPVFWDDALLGILEASFGTSDEKIYYDFSKHGVTLLSLAHMIQKNNPDIKIDFTKEELQPQPVIQKKGTYLLSETYPIEERLSKLKIRAGSFEQKKEVYKEDVKKNLPNVPFINTRLIIFSFILFMFLPLITTLFFTFIAFLTLDLTRGNFETKYLLNFSKASFDFASAFSKTLIYETEFLQIQPITKLTESIEKNRKEIGSVFDYYNALDLFSKGEIIQGTALLKNFIILDQSKNFIALGPKLENFISQTIDLWPQIFASGSKKTYLVLFQNNFTPRPTGGLIQTFAFLTFKDGKFSDFKVYSTNDSDKNLKGHVEPPFPLRRYLLLTNLLMKDSNFNPDFLESAMSSSFFANLEEGQKVDGVIGVDLNFLGVLKKDIGENPEVFLESAKENSANPSFIKEAVIDLSNKLKNRDSFKIFMSEGFIDLIQSKSINFQFNDQSIENVFLSNNYSSALLDNRDNSPKKINDFISVMESNLGSPVNNIERKLTMKAGISENGDILSNIILEYKNLGYNDYKNYLRFILPDGSTIVKIKLDGVDTDFTNAITDPSIYEAKDFIPPQKLEVENYSQSGKSFFGFLTQIPKGEVKKIEFAYKLSTPSLSGASDFSYSLRFFKQPGILPYPFNFSISYPDGFKISEKPSYSITTEKDFDLNLNFSQK